jgi:hypothetical protein
MTYTHLRERKTYEDLYDRLTVEEARRGMVYYDDFYAEFESKLPASEKIDRPGNAFLINVFYMETVGNELLHRYEEREQKITEWTDRDKAKDVQVSSDGLAKEPHCNHCGKQGLRIIDKDLMSRRDNPMHVDADEVLFMLHCPSCDKNSASWEDGTAWSAKPILCPECSFEMTHKTTRSKTAITFKYSCSSCSHVYKDKMDLSDKKDEPDPEYDSDRRYFCLEDTEFRDRLFRMRHDFLGMAQLGKEFQEREDNKHVYDAIEEMKRPKIAELQTLLRPVLEKAGYIEFGMDKPEIGKDVFVGFSCLDGKPDRPDYDSRKTLEKLVKKTLEDTNWRLMGEGISYRLGYLNARLRAYEREEDLKRLVSKKKNLKLGKSSSNEKNAWSIQDSRVRDIIL